MTPRFLTVKHASVLLTTSELILFTNFINEVYGLFTWCSEIFFFVNHKRHLKVSMFSPLCLWWFPLALSHIWVSKNIHFYLLWLQMCEKTTCVTSSQLFLVFLVSCRHNRINTLKVILGKAGFVEWHSLTHTRAWKSGYLILYSSTAYWNSVTKSPAYPI